MKYLPLIWAALRRKPTLAILTLVSIVIAFFLFGLLMGINASFDAFAERARLDRLDIYSRFGINLPMAYAEQISQTEGVTRIMPMNGIGGFYQDEKNRVFVFMVDESLLDMIPEIGVTRDEFAALKRVGSGLLVSEKRAQQFGLKPGDQFPIQTMTSIRNDGAKLWTFQVVAIVRDWENAPNGYMIGNYDYLDNARLDKNHGTADFFEALVKDQNRAAEISKTIEAHFANSGNSVRAIPEKTQIQSGATAIIDLGFVTHAIVTAAMLMILFLTGNGIAQSVRERIPEFAVMKTLGFSDRAVMALVFAEALVPFVIGARLGLGASWVLGSILNAALPPGVALPPPTISLSLVGWALLIAVIVALVSAVLPARRVQRLQIADALSGR